MSKRIAATLLLSALGLSACSQLAPSIPSGGPKPEAAGTTAPDVAGPSGGATSSESSSPSAPPSSPASSPASSQPSSPAGSTEPAPAAEPPTQISAAAKAAKAQLGVHVYWHDLDDAATARANADRLFDYVVGLGANSVAISFPIYVDGVRPTKAYTIPGKTPSPATLGIVLAEASARGLRTTVRPLVDEANILDSQGDWRGSIRPVDATTFFASYQAVLNPYLDQAQASKAATFVVGAELDSLVHDTDLWKTLTTAAGQRFSGQLAYADNWTEWADGLAAIPNAVTGIDAYPELKVSNDATVAQLTSAWTAWLKHRPASTLSKTVMQEVGIVATDGAYSQPVKWEVAGQAVNPRIQIDWFTAACGAARSLNMDGLYFWNLDAYTDPSHADPNGPGSFVQRGDEAIKSCFASGWEGQ
ncbi:hypothetical protein GCM10009839_01040 [Catenulispora yoronensis]|uniref:Uncharacterized protein n=1 Tax=Catenulispora yoronensis TaxID=450799 RepID=A0ABN2TKE8_9ACTN